MEISYKFCAQIAFWSAGYFGCFPFLRVLLTTTGYAPFQFSKRIGLWKWCIHFFPSESDIAPANEEMEDSSLAGFKSEIKIEDKIGINFDPMLLCNMEQNNTLESHIIIEFGWKWGWNSQRPCWVWPITAESYKRNRNGSYLEDVWPICWFAASV